jgi:excisionase family DNA binding protein
MATNTYLTVSEAARLLGVSRTTIWRWIDKGRLRAYRVGQRTIRIRDEDLEAQLTPIQQPGSESPKPGKEDIWANYDPVKARRALESLRGLFKDIDTDQLKRDLREARSQKERVRPR